MQGFFYIHKKFHATFSAICHLLSTNPNAMRKRYSLLLLTTVVISLNAQTINFPDPNLKARLLEAAPTNYIAQNSNLAYIKIDSNNDGEIQVSEALQVRRLNIDNQTYYYGTTPYNSYITSLDGISNFQNLISLNCSYNHLTTINLNLPQLENFDCSYNQLPTLNLNGISNNLKYLSCSYNLLPSINVNSITSLEWLFCSNNYLTSLNINNLVHLTSLDCSNNLIGTLDLSPFPNLQVLLCSNTGLSSLDVTGQNLITLFCDGNAFQVLDLSNQTALKSLRCHNNQLTILDVSNSVLMENLICFENQIGVLNVSNMPNLVNLNCDSNNIQVLDLDNKIHLNSVYCSNNLLTTLSISNANLLNQIACANNLLQTLNINNNAIENTVEFYGNPTLTYVCADGGQIIQIQDLVNQYGYTNCAVNSMCSTNTNGPFYTVLGNSKLDYDTNGCSLSDFNYPNLKITFSDGTNSGYIIGSESGNYDYDVPAGTFSITPELENPNYFNINPTTSSVTFPAQGSPFVQDFCVTANGIHNDLEVTVIPMSAARPGFDAHYKIIYKNKGTGIQSGSVSLTFDDAVSDFVAANPNFTTQSNSNVSWGFTNLIPLEKREIDFTLNLNSPVETPPLLGGAILNYTVFVVGTQNDETIDDNTSEVNQIVVNSFDPNDIVCLEGETISTDKVGDYVHYRIRFENTGTANAENIIVKDTIDIEKFDINSLISIDASNHFETRVAATGEVNFVFNNINLPFDDANNDGYIAFKIRTKPTLNIGDTFSNTAKIYFDFNAPIVTNTAVTTIVANSDFELENYFTVAPNPVKSILNLQSFQAVQIGSISIFNTLGQEILLITEPNNLIDVSNLKSGAYFIKVFSAKGTYDSRFLKQ